MAKTKAEVNEAYRNTEKGKKVTQEAQARYFQTKKGKQAKERYLHSDKGQQALLKARENYQNKQEERKPFGPLFAEYRVKKGLSREKVAEKFGVTPRAVVSWEQGARGIKPEIQKELTKMLGNEYKKALKELKEKLKF